MLNKQEMKLKAKGVRSMLSMPGLPKHPAALDMDIDDTGRITGLF
ncbi:hypothetical protein kuro4_16390 [Gelria sp. Kuro-4]|nr:formate--tetrahydrofolate ligase [Gelria sp. Kuro-4]BCV24866.1 hypothetical protein kuro4_16390 [Gelria sp. Kuro-4]